MEQTTTATCNKPRYAMYGPCGVKRKFDEVESMAVGGTYIEQRQTLLDISMYKLRMLPTRRTEPSLRRSVLIYNTLRVIEYELQAEGVAPNTVTPNLFPQMQGDDVGEMNLEPLPGLEHGQMSGLVRPDCPPSPLPTPMDTLSVTDMPRTPFCSPPLPCPSEVPPPPNSSPPSPEDSSSSSSSDEGEVEPEPIIHTLQPVTNAHKLASPTTDVLLNNDRLAPFTSVLFDLDSRTAGHHHHHHHQHSVVPMMATGRSVTHLSTASSQRYNGQQYGQVDIFGDIDLTLYDFDLLSSFSSNVKMAPLSAEELMHSFPADTPPALTSPSPCFRNELLNDDLDHIMQVLVGI